ncbi:DUF5034 domain-containing protein [Subsaxibacter sp. CAU 1640]|uniref:DUF5034 domain-containing protein n=1 Tax=Subsaxibacter sp. CAU 1640 TaxID=2933271 RepID=UPI00200609DF|nr:DUF5034 domain-containing protein [Subsaxibacter sp. CAU 1640]MCK7591750.1 DUF5034 domain-containing protein [Subsaxibacter sp. CAU 1640]
MKKIILFIVLVFNIQGFLISCGCPDENYVDFSEISLLPDFNIVSEGEFLNLYVSIEDLYYTTSVNSFSNLNYIANATTVCEKGRDGLKYPIVNVSVFSDSDFDSEHPAGTDLSDIFKAYGLYEYNGTLTPTDYDFINLLDPAYLTGTSYVMESRPQIDMTHRFEVRFEKVNGEIVNGFSEEITWE